MSGTTGQAAGVVRGNSARAEDVVALLESTGLSPAVGGVVQMTTPTGNVGLAAPAVPGAGFLELSVNSATVLIPAYTPAQLGASVSGGSSTVSGGSGGTTTSGGSGGTTVSGGSGGTVVTPVQNAGTISLAAPLSAVSGTQITLNGTFSYTAGTLSAIQVLIDNTLLTGLTARVNGPAYSVNITVPTAGNHNISVIDGNNTSIQSKQVAWITTAPAIPAGQYQPAVFDPTTMKGQDFTLVPKNSPSSMINSQVFTHCFTDSDTPAVGFYFAGPPDGLWITSNNDSIPVANQYGFWSQTGFEQLYTGPSGGFGYGTFHWRMRSCQLKQGPGINLIMWRTDNKWLEADCGNQYTEIDVAEAWGYDGSSTFTFHWYDPTASGNNGQVYHGIPFPAGTDNTTFHDYDLIWTRGSMAFYLDGVQVFNDTSSHIPKSFADGDCNRTIGAQVVIQSHYETTADMQMALQNCWWSASTTPPASTSSIATVAPGTVTTLALSYPNGVNFTAGNPVNVTVTAANGAAAAGALVYWAMWNGGATTDNYASHPVALGAAGTATFAVQPVNNGDYVMVVGSTATFMPVASGRQLFVLGAAIVSTAPVVAGLTLSWTAGSTRVGAGTLSVTVTANNGAAAAGATVWGAVFNGYNAYSNFSDNPVVLNAAGVGTSLMYFTQTGDYPEFTANLSNPGSVYAYLGPATIN